MSSFTTRLQRLYIALKAVQPLLEAGHSDAYTQAVAWGRVKSQVSIGEVALACKVWRDVQALCEKYPSPHTEGEVGDLPICDGGYSARAHTKHSTALDSCEYSVCDWIGERYGRD